MPAYDLARFLNAQSDTYACALDEVRSGQKRTHWMWFVFPQIIGLGSSEMSVHYAIGSIEEAKAYLAHPVLGTRLREITEAINASGTSNPASILGPIDARKFHSSMTLFDSIVTGQSCFRLAIEKFFAGGVDAQTVRQIAAWRQDAAR